MTSMTNYSRGNLIQRTHSIIIGTISDNLDEIHLALEEDASCINDQDDRLGATALHIAAGDGNLPLVKFFCAQPGCDPYIRDHSGRLPTTLALAIDRVDIFDEIARLMTALTPSDAGPSSAPSNVVTLPTGPRPPSV